LSNLLGNRSNEEKVVVCELLALEYENNPKSEFTAMLIRALIELSTPTELINEIKLKIA
jgi:hypothetical protein